MSNQEFEGGEDVTDQFELPRRPAGMVVSVRLNAQEAEECLRLAEQTHRTVSRVIKDAVLGKGGNEGFNEGFNIQATSQEAFWIQVPACGTAYIRESGANNMKRVTGNRLHPSER